MGFLERTDRAAVLRHLESLDADVYVRSVNGETRRLIFQATAASSTETADVPAEEFCKLASRVCAETILGSNREPVADAAWWYEQRPDVLRECWELSLAISGLSNASSAAAKKNLSGTTKNDSCTDSPGTSAASTPTNCAPATAAAN